jgi:uncharacterized heparinase superfamily protein
MGHGHHLKYYRNGNKLNLKKTIHAKTSYFKNNEFEFLNKKQKFTGTIDWNFEQYGKLWNYNLNYFNYLNQKDINLNTGLELVSDFLSKYKNNKYGFDSYPISQRVINWIKWLSYHNLNSKEIDKALFLQCKLLYRNLEYHLMGNHLLENGFALLFAAYYFRDESMYKKAKKILEIQLEEQILEDGAHFELSPMYHQEILFRVLDGINLVENNEWKDTALNPLFKEKAKKMLKWINSISFDNGEIPLLNDSSKGIAPDTFQLNKYSENLGLKINDKNHCLSSSGYRKIIKDRYEMLIDIGNIGPDYIPGHAHSDTFNFVLWVNKRPLIVDTGISTYENNHRRILERSTESHNTVKVDDKEQTQVWNSFKVARRAKIVYLKENENIVCSTHDGYKKIGAFHTREFKLEEQLIKIIDFVKSEKEHTCFFNMHFYPGINLKIKNKKEIICDNCSIGFMNHEDIQIDHYYYAPGFNELVKANLLKIIFKPNIVLSSLIYVN